ncbi:class I adenylate-forming enzyme family protein [Blastomonas sp.]|uniref:class I adenylate-forming enzyme family protein n=1 Tax=Blastomonas sp. TaxID=1909299 RepID=UPI003593D26D
MTDAVPALTIARSIVCAAARAPRKRAICAPSRDLTYGELASRIAQVAALAAEEAMLTRGDLALLIAPNCPEYIELVAGLSASGTAVVTANPMLSPPEILRIVEDCQPRAIWIDPDLAETRDALAATGLPVFATRGMDYEARIARYDGAALAERAQGEDCFGICYTSGTTGKPKGVMISHRSRVLTIHAMAAEYGCFGPDDHFLALTPLCHGAGFAFAVAPLLFGGTTTLAHDLKAPAILARLAEGDVTGLFIVPTHAKWFLELGDTASAMVAGHRLKALISNAAAMPQAHKRHLVDLFGEGLYHETYGSTEGGIVTNIRPQDQLRKHSSVGTPFANMEIQLRDDEGNLVEGAGIGELFCRSPYVFNGYLGKPEETKAALSDGWLTVGDVARRDEEGFYHIVDRKSDLIISGGLNVYPKEIEQAAEAVPGLVEGAAAGVSDAEWGEAIHYYYVASGPDDIAPLLNDAFAANLARYKRPKVLVRIDELPRSPAGKLLRNQLSPMAK